MCFVLDFVVVVCCCQNKSVRTGLNCTRNTIGKNGWFMIPFRPYYEDYS